jgi:hypothetical protein
MFPFRELGWARVGKLKFALHFANKLSFIIVFSIWREYACANRLLPAYLVS